MNIYFPQHISIFWNFVFSLSFSNDGTVLAIASSYMYENVDNPPDPLPEDSIYIRHVSDQETKPKQTSRDEAYLQHHTIQKLHLGFNSTLILGHLLDTLLFMLFLLSNTRPYKYGVLFSHFIKVADKKNHSMLNLTERENPSLTRILNITIFNLVAPSTGPHVDDL